MAKPSRGPKRAQPSDSEYESRLRMSWIDEGGIDLRAARANLLEFVAGLYEDALKLLQEPEPEANAAPEPRAASAARKAPLRKKKPPMRMKKKLPAPRQKKKRPPPGQKKKVLPRRKTGGKKRK
jgi:hypothetical protein